MNKFDRLCEQLFKANIPFSRNERMISIRPDNADRSIYISVYAGASSYCWCKRISNTIESGATENLQSLLARIMNFYADYENTP